MEMLFPSTPVPPSRAWVGSMLLLPVCLYVCLSGEPTNFLATVSTLLYEGGQSLLGLVSERGYLVGGIVFQLFVPFAFFVFFTRYRFCFGMQVFLVWLGQNLIHVGRYGPDSTDWPEILHVLGLANHDYAIGMGAVALGGVLFLTALVLPAFVED